MLHCPSWPSMDHGRWRPNMVEIAPNCPRCASSNTKFCYYNNYSLSQPRYFCKGCRRYWTKGGSLRNVPVGGGCRKSRRAKSSAMRGSRSESSLKSETSGNSFNWSSPSSSQSGSGGSDIDLAAVFAKYLNQESDSEKPELTPNQESGIDAAVGCVEQAEAVQESDFMFAGDYDRRQELEEWHEMINEYGAENDQILLRDHEMAVRDFQLWSDSTGELPDLAWQPMVRPEELDSFSAEDHFEIISPGLMGDMNSWNSASFDLYSGLEVFSGP